MNREEYILNYKKTKQYRATNLINSYKTSDNKCGRGECTLTSKELIQLWEQGCNWCGEKDWRKLGADRIDNNKPHTLDNCVCACWKCNTERSINMLKKNVAQYTLEGAFIKDYESYAEAERQTGICNSHISECCKGIRKTAGGFKWKFN